MLTYKELNELKEMLDKLPNELFFMKESGPYVYQFGIEKPVCTVTNQLYNEYFRTLDPVLVKEMVRYMLYLKKKHTHKRRK